MEHGNFIYTPDNKFMLHPGCRDSFREDRAHGLIYGAYKVIFAGKIRLANPSLYSVTSGDCIYCGNSLGIPTIKKLRSHLARYLRKFRKV